MFPEIAQEDRRGYHHCENNDFLSLYAFQPWK